MTVAESYAWCRQETQSKARNFHYAFLLLPPEKRDAMCAVYAFMRHTDDLSDEPGAAAPALNAWRAELDAALAGRFGTHSCWPAFHDTVQRYRIPHRYFHEMLDGVMADLEPHEFATFDDLYRYCYRVASVVGLTTIHIFGFHDDEALVLAEKCGIAFQLTNILRDVKEDEERGRNYLPREDRVKAPNRHALFALEAERAQRYYEESARLVDMVSPDSRRAMWALIEIYRRLLQRIIQSGFDVYRRRIALSTVEKLLIVAEAWLRRPARAAHR